MARYGLPDNPTTPTTITEWRQDTSTKLLLMPDGSQKVNPSHGDYLAAGWLEHIDDTPGADEKLDRNQFSFYTETVSYLVVDKTQEELNADISGPAKAVQTENLVLDFLSGAFAYATKDQVIEIVDTRFPTDTDFGAMSPAEQVVALNALYDNINWMGRKLGSNLVQLNGLLRTQYNENKNVTDATVAPTINDDVTQGWSVGSLWRNVTPDPDDDYECLDSVEGAAIWVIV